MTASRLDRKNGVEFWIQVAFSVVFVAAGFAVLLFDLGSGSNDKLAAGWVGAVLGFWLQ